MNGEVEDERTETPPVDPDSAVKLRGDPPRVMRSVAEGHRHRLGLRLCAGWRRADLCASACWQEGG
jgi:hypothetical protein